MMPVDYLFRLDADSQIGTGHLMRCLAIADTLSAQGGRCGFLCKPLSSALLGLLSSHVYLSITDDTEALSRLSELKPQWLIVDHYGLDIRFEQAAATQVAQILVLDDLADRHHQATLLLDQGPLRQETEYRPLINADCRLLLGPDYALLRPIYRQLRKNHCNEFRRGLIGFGGADPAHACLQTLHTLIDAELIHHYQWTLLAGAANPDYTQLHTLITQQQLPVTLLQHSDEVAQLLATHDFAIGAAGGMTWERCCIGIPTLSIPIADNQQFNDAVIAHYQLGERLSLRELAAPARLHAALDALQQEADTYRQRGQALLDGLGLERIATLLRTIS